jgi:hypothetical protein
MEVVIQVTGEPDELVVYSSTPWADWTAFSQPFCRFTVNNIAILSRVAALVANFVQTLYSDDQ